MGAGGVGFAAGGMEAIGDIDERRGVGVTEPDVVESGQAAGGCRLPRTARMVRSGWVARAMPVSMRTLGRAWSRQASGCEGPGVRGVTYSSGVNKATTAWAWAKARSRT